jgi:serine/threonine protein kinase
VYKCRDILSLSVVAIKEFIKGKQQPERFEDKLNREISITSKLKHSYIVEFHRYIRWEDRHFMTMEYC